MKNVPFVQDEIRQRIHEKILGDTRLPEAARNALTPLLKKGRLTAEKVLRACSAAAPAHGSPPAA